uniref:Uncharacterized protein n=1 Tax=Gallus gallus TaxID=9031 RepID=A0A8V0Z2E0_CHICK
MRAKSKNLYCDLGNTLKQHLLFACDDVQGIAKLAVPCLACCSGVKLTFGLIYRETQGMPKAVVRTLTDMDVVCALGHQDHTLCGFCE